MSSDDRTHYERWQARYDDWFERCRAQHDDDIEIDARPYARLLDDHGPPALSRNVETALFGNMPHVTIDMTDEQIKRLYDDYLETAR
ncbi:hypothetical protein [Nitrobacter winogradskyi]|uniref:hypothetical protein n=1 Tax=Nitrobacter winogradskyi TaxID=913 RepID=UPI001AED5702|nr:hypothetical protein [Nitrobacter winogradskyi]